MREALLESIHRNRETHLSSITMPHHTQIPASCSEEVVLQMVSLSRIKTAALAVAARDIYAAEMPCPTSNRELKVSPERPPTN